tara:strand:- start:1496 stop:2584 length:1089 start_codon:yes stop_codon:yes gene_type:complete
MDFALNVPINQVSFGQVSINLLKEIFLRRLSPSIFPIGGNVDLNGQSSLPDGFEEWLGKCLDKGLSSHSRGTPIIKLWHLNGGMESFAQKQILISFYELDSPTAAELNTAKNNNLLFSSKYCVDIFNQFGASCDFLPLSFDESNFKEINKKYFSDDRIVFNISGKFEKRKNHLPTIKSWVKKYGNDKKYSLQCSIYNNFLSKEKNAEIANFVTGGKKYFNVSFLPYMPSNDVYNDYLNSADIILGLSGGEGWGLPEFHSVALGKHSVILDCSGYKSWANNSNSTLVEPSGKEEAYDGVFFKKGSPYNQGNIFKFNEDNFIEACEKVIGKVRDNKVNKEGKKLRNKFTTKKTVDLLLKKLEDI